MYAAYLTLREGTMGYWRAWCRVAANALIGNAAWYFAAGVIPQAMQRMPPLSLMPGHLVHESVGFAVFLALMLRDIAAGLNREGR